MSIRSLLLFVLLLFPLTVFGGKLYKVVDENGNITFSQFPPVEKEENAIIENIAVNSSSQSTITEGVDGRYCGKIKLLDQSSSGYSSASYIKSLDRKRTSWQQQLDRLNANLDRSHQQQIDNNKSRSAGYSRYNQSYQAKQSQRYQESITANTETLRDLHCALSWADGEHEGTNEFIANQRLERERLAKIRDDLKITLQANCGQIPPYDPSAGRNNAVRKRWYDCSDKLRREIDLLQREISKL